MGDIVSALELLTRLLDGASRLIATDAPIAARFLGAASAVNATILAARRAGRDLTPGELAALDEAERAAVAGWDSGMTTG